MARTITSANSVLMLTIPGVFPAPVQIQGFAADDIFSMAEVDMAETIMGADGKLSAGWVPAIKTLDIMLQADSTSNDFFDAWILAESIAREKFPTTGTIRLLGIGRIYAMTSGFLRKGNVLPDAKKVMQPRKFTIEFESITGAPT